MIGPGVCIAIQADLSSFEGCVGLANELSSREKRRLSQVPDLTLDLDVLVHNSGNNWGAPFEEYVFPLPLYYSINGSRMPHGIVCWD